MKKEFALVSIEKFKDVDGNPSCFGCPMLSNDSDWGEKCSIATFTRSKRLHHGSTFLVLTPNETCPVWLENKT